MVTVRAGRVQYEPVWPQGVGMPAGASTPPQIMLHALLHGQMCCNALQLGVPAVLVQYPSSGQGPVVGGAAPTSFGA